MKTWQWIVIGLLGVGVVGAIVNPSGNDPEPTTSPTAEPTSTQTEEPAPDLTTPEGLAAAITSKLGEENNMGVPRNVDVSLYEGDLFVSYVLDENLTNNLLIVGAWQDIEEIVKLAQLSGLSNNLTVNATLELFDTNGNSVGQTYVVTANFLDDKLPLLNTENLAGRDMWEKASSFYVYHPAIRD